MSAVVFSSAFIGFCCDVARQDAVQFWALSCPEADSGLLIWDLILSEALGIPFHVLDSLTMGYELCIHLVSLVVAKSACLCYGVSTRSVIK